MRKLMILATAIAAVAAIALPASASAATSNWKMGGETLTENGSVEVTGTAAFTGGTTCNINSHGTLEAGTGTGSLSTFETSNCVPTETLAAVCSSVTSVTAEGLPWMADDEGGNIKISGVHITNHYSGGLFCPSTITIEDDEGVFITPANTEAMSTGSLSGTVNTSYGTQEVSGSGELTEGSGTFGL